MSSGSADAGVAEHPLKLGEIRSGERPVAAQLLQRDVILVGAQVDAGLGAEALEVAADGQAGQVDLGCLAELVGEVGVDDDPAWLSR